MPSKVRLFLKRGLAVYSGPGIKFHLDEWIAGNRLRANNVWPTILLKKLPRWMAIVEYVNAAKKLGMNGAELTVWRERKRLRVGQSAYRELVRLYLGKRSKGLPFKKAVPVARFGLRPRSPEVDVVPENWAERLQRAAHPSGQVVFMTGMPVAPWGDTVVAPAPPPDPVAPDPSVTRLRLDFNTLYAQNFRPQAARQTPRWQDEVQEP